MNIISQLAALSEAAPEGGYGWPVNAAAVVVMLILRFSR